MYTLTNFIYCLNAERAITKNGKGENINAIGVLSALIPEFVPGTFSFSIIFSVLGVNVSKQNTIQILFYKEGEENVLVDSGLVNLPTMTETDTVGLPDEYVGLNMSMDFRNVIFESEGVYNTRIYFNGELLGTNPVYVKGKR